MLKLFALLIVLAIPSVSSAGVTIHYSGKVANTSKVKQVYKVAQSYATERKWKVESIHDGIKIYPHEWCEPINLIFSDTTLSENFVKTQFAGPEIHKEVVGLFKAMKPMMVQFKVEDEGEYWETSDYKKLKANIDKTNEMMKKHKSENPRLRGPNRLPNGLIVDLFE